MLVERIKELAKSKNISLAQVERDLNFGNSTIRKWSESSPNVERVKLIAEYFNVSTDYLLGKTDHKNLEKDVKRYENFDKLSNQDVAEELNFLLEQLGSDNYALLFDGNEIDDETRELLISSLKNTYNIAQSLINKNT